MFSPTASLCLESVVARSAFRVSAVTSRNRFAAEVPSSTPSQLISRPFAHCRRAWRGSSTSLCHPSNLRRAEACGAWRRRWGVSASFSAYTTRSFLGSIATSLAVTVVARTRRTRPLEFVARSWWRGRGTRRDAPRHPSPAQRAGRREGDDLSLFVRSATLGGVGRLGSCPGNQPDLFEYRVPTSRRTLIPSRARGAAGPRQERHASTAMGSPARSSGCVSSTFALPVFKSPRPTRP